jgi:hypothetical protein
MRLSSSATTLHNPTSGNVSRRSTADMLQFTCTRDTSSHHRVPVGGLKDAITSHPENLHEADKLRRPGCLVVGRIEESLEILSMEDHPSALIEPVASVFLPSGTSEDEKVRSRHELERCDQKDWSR